MSTRQKEAIDRMSSDLVRATKLCSELSFKLALEQRDSSIRGDELFKLHNEARTWAHMFRVLAYKLLLRRSPWK